MAISDFLMSRNLWPRDAALAILFACTLGLSHQLLAQQPEQAPPPATPKTQTKPATGPGAATVKPAPDPKVLEHDRILWTLPNYGTVDKASTLPPLTAGQKFKIVARGTFDPAECAFIGIVAGVNQASNTDPRFGQGLKGYAKRYGTAFTDNAIGNFMTNAVFPSMLHQDPRYYQMGKGGFFHRVVYAGSRVLITRSDSGKTQFNFSEFLGNGVAAGISNAYHPPPRTLVSNISVWATQIGWDAAAYELKEFWPDIHRLFKRNHKM